MKKYLKSLLAISVAAAFAVTGASTVYADGLYVGVGAYQADFDKWDVDDEETVPALFVGYNFIDTNIFMMSVEMGYYDLGDYDGTVLGQEYDIEANALTLAAVGYLPVGPLFEVYVKAGVAAVNAEIEFGNLDKDADGEELFGGVGFSFDILDTIDIYAEYLTFDTEINSDIYGVGVRLDF